MASRAALVSGASRSRPPLPLMMRKPPPCSRVFSASLAAGERQRHQFRHAQAGGIEHFQQAGGAAGAQQIVLRPGGVVEPLARDLQQPVHLVDR